MEEPVDSVEFAKYIIISGFNLNEGIDSTAEKITLGETKIHKLLYICDGFMLASGINFIGEHARAWNYGPVYPRVHTWLSKHWDIFTNPKKYLCEEEDAIKRIKADELVHVVLNSFGRMTASQISAWSHRPGSPWEKALKRNKGVMNGMIEKDDMRDYFLGLVRENQ